MYKLCKRYAQRKQRAPHAATRTVLEHVVLPPIRVSGRATAHAHFSHASPTHSGGPALKPARHRRASVCCRGVVAHFFMDFSNKHNWKVEFSVNNRKLSASP